MHVPHSTRMSTCGGGGAHVGEASERAGTSGALGTLGAAALR
ncbi:hypothetical protein [Polyangium jinanense]|nr:hypothetical protein [Polyangium jinanense]